MDPLAHDTSRAHTVVSFLLSPAAAASSQSQRRLSSTVGRTCSRPTPTPTAHSLAPPPSSPLLEPQPAATLPAPFPPRLPLQRTPPLGRGEHPLQATRADTRIQGCCSAPFSGSQNRSVPNSCLRSRRATPPNFVDPALPFLPAAYDDVEFVDCCNGLLLCRCQRPSPRPHGYDIDCVVCNPATGKWTVLPSTEAMEGIYSAYLGFDPAVSPHFTVFLLLEYSRFLEEDDAQNEDADTHHQILGVDIYSSATGRWTRKRSGWDDRTRVFGSSGVFFNGALHVTSFDSSVITVDTEGNSWRKIPTPYYSSYIGTSQGYLYAAHHNEDDSQRSIWVLEDYGGQGWILKETIDAVVLFRTSRNFSEDGIPPRVNAFHPDCNLIFIVFGTQRNLVSYDMDKRKVHDICTIRQRCVYRYIPYVPCFSDWLSNGLLNVEHLHTCYCNDIGASVRVGC